MSGRSGQDGLSSLSRMEMQIHHHQNLLGPRYIGDMRS
jgi:hypothetical protein